MSASNLSDRPLKVINMGLEAFADDLKAHDVAVVHMDWRPPSGGDARLLAMLALLNDDDD